MTKDVLLSIKGLYTEDNEDADSIETLTPAEFYIKENVYYLFFEEIMDDSTGVTKSRIKYSDKCFELTRKGEVSVHLLFEEGKKTLNTYQIPYGNLVVGLDTKRIHMNETEDEIRIIIDYAMEINYQQVSDNTIDITIKAVYQPLISERLLK
jgi:uncharacterized beta-barrel protein YwiB (DUF1934 family)